MSAVDRLDVTARAASLTAGTSWSDVRPARDRMHYCRGLHRGYELGYRDGRGDAPAEASSPRKRVDLDMLLRQSQYSDAPCQRPGCRGCSACTRAAAVAENRRRFNGSPDFPGLKSIAAADSVVVRQIAEAGPAADVAAPTTGARAA